MKLSKLLILFFLLSYSALANKKVNADKDYTYYHKQVMEAEKLIADEKFQEALAVYENIFRTYDFIFVRDYQVATQLALHLHDNQKAVSFIKKGIEGGWRMTSIRKNKYLSALRKTLEWKAIRKEYPALRKQYQERLHQPVRKQVKKMFAQDQKKALGALFTFSAKKQDSYAEKKFAPHSEKQISALIHLIQEHGYPGERLIGNHTWVATILSHHNSISQAYVQKDTLYQFLKPQLMASIRNGQMSPWEFAIIDDWYQAVKSSRQEVGYGYLNSPSRAGLLQVNELRQNIGLRTVETRNRLYEIEQQTGMNFYLPGSPWVKGKITFEE